MTFSDHVAHAVGAGSIAAIAAIGVYSTRSIGRDLIESHERIAEVWCAMVERAAARWHAIADLRRQQARRAKSEEAARG